MKEVKFLNKDGFTCINCGKHVLYESFGTKNRNHCPYCLCSKHVDITIGDRSNKCGGVMRCIGKLYKPDGEEVLVHKCDKCDSVRKNRVAGDDDWDLVGLLPVLEADALMF